MKPTTILKLFVFPLCLVPLALLAWKGFHDGLGANPIEVITHSTGDWTIIFLLITLSITPLRRVPALNWLIRFRRMMGLYAFFYGVLHFTTYIWLDKFFDLPEMIKDVGKRPFITVGFLGFVMMIPLAVTQDGKELGKLAPAGLPQRHRGRSSLLVAGEDRHHQAAAVCGDSDDPPGMARSCVGDEKVPDAGSARRALPERGLESREQSRAGRRSSQRSSRAPIFWARETYRAACTMTAGRTRRPRHRASL